MISWQCKHFKELSNLELYAIIRLRIAVFSIEQQCIYQDCDNRDEESWHLMGWANGQLVAYARLLPPELVYDTASIGRVVTDTAVRGTGMGRELMRTAIQNIHNLFGSTEITISAQLYLKDFYASFNFKTVGESYLEDQIDHIKMKTHN